MSLTEDKLTNKTAVFNEWIARYTELKPYTKDGVPRILKADSLSGFNPPFGPVKTWIDDLKKQRGRSGGTTDPASAPRRLPHHSHLRYSSTHTTPKQIKINW